MKKLLFIFSLTTFLVVSGSVQAQTWTKEKLQNMYLSYLKDIGMEGWVDSDGDIQFSHDDRTFFIGVDEDDTEYFRLVLPNIWSIESIAEGIQVVQACDAVNREKKVCKAYTTNDNVWICVELFVSNPTDFKAIFQRSLVVIDQSVDLFVENM